MKKICLLIIFASFYLQGQNKITLKDGTVDNIVKFKQQKKKVFYKTKSGETGTAKTRDIILLEYPNPSKEYFEFNPLGFTDYVVTNIDSLSSNQLYEKTINWIKDTYKNPEEVIKAKFENEKVRFTGYNPTHLSSKVLMSTIFYDVRYTVEISFKDNKYKFEPTSLEIYVNPSEYGAGGWSPINLDITTGYYKKNGLINPSFSEFPNQISSLFNDLEDSLETYLLKENNTLKDKENDW